MSRNVRDEIFGHLMKKPQDFSWKLKSPNVNYVLRVRVRANIRRGRSIQFNMTRSLWWTLCAVCRLCLSRSWVNVMLLSGERWTTTPCGRSSDWDLADLSSVHERQLNYEHISIFMPLTFTENAHISSVRGELIIWQQHFSSQILSFLFPPQVIWSASVNLTYGNHGMFIIQRMLTFMNRWMVQLLSRFVSVLLLYHC